MEQQIDDLIDGFSSLPDDGDRKAFLASFPQLRQSDVVEQLAEAVRREVRVDVRKALRLAEGALAIARELRDKAALGRALRAKANALWFMGQCRAAVHFFEDAALLFEEVGNMNEVGRTLSTSLQSLTLLGEYERAFSAANKARTIFAGLGESSRLARLEINVANIYHRQNRFADALAAYRRAYEQLLPHKDAEAIGVALHNMAVCLIALDDFRGALETYRSVRELCERNEMPLLVAQADYNIAYLFYLRGEYSQALELLRATREMCVKNGDSYHLGLCDLDQSEIYVELSLVDEAREMAQKSFQQFQELGMGYEAARSLANLAIAVSLGGNSPHGLELFAQAKDMFAREGNQVWPSLLDLYQSLLLFNEGQFAEARRLCIAALEFFRSVALPSKHVLCHLLVARLCLQTEELDEALRNCACALQLLTKLESPMLVYQARFLMGQVEEALGRPDKAYESYQTARLSLETLRSSLEAEELKIGFMKNRLDVYARLFQICLNRNGGQASTEEAFLYIEEAKSRSLRDLIFGRTEPARALDKEESQGAKRIRDVRKELNWYYHRIELEQLSQEKISLEQIESLKRQARAREQELLRLQRDQPIRSTGAARNVSKAIPVREIRSTLGSEAALLEYFCIEDRLFAAVLTGENLQIIPVSLASRVIERLRMLQFQMSKFRMGGDYVSRFKEALLRSAQAHLQAVYEEIIAPVHHLLTVRHLIIVPDGPLHSLPFHALFDGRQYLIDRFSVCYAPSASIYALCHRESDRAMGPSLLLGIDDAKMPFARQEVQAVAAVVPQPEILLGSDATEQALRAKGRKSRLIHIASHGYFRQDSPMFSAIRLADSYLSLYDLCHMNLPVDLLTLSGCVTGLNVIADGDELLGLARGLLYAGARSLLLSLWDVDDRSTADFMTLFYSRLLDNRDKAEALQKAMLELRSRYPHPYYWAPFKLVGKGLAS